MESLQSTTIDLHVQSPSQISTYAKLESQGEYDKWPLINYGRSESKSTQELLFDAASEKDLDMARQKWELFKGAVENESLSKHKVKKIIGTLDEDKEWAALHYAVYCNNLSLCDRLTSKLDKYQCDVNILGGDGENVLHVVSQSNCIWQDTGDGTIKEFPDIIKLLIEDHRADVNHADDEGRTPLHMAAMRGRLRYIKYLIHHGAKVDVASHPAITSPSLIDQKEEQQNVKKKLMKLFTTNKMDETQIPVVFDMIARRKQNEQFNHLENLFEKASPQTQEQIIRLACRYDNVALLRWLINRPAPKGYTSKINCAEYTPLLTAIFYNSAHCSIDGEHQLPLLAVGAEEQDNVLHICAKRQVSIDILDMIINKLSTRNIAELMQTKDSSGNLPLHLAAQINTEDELKIWKELIKKKNVSPMFNLLLIKNRRGNTVAHEASEHGNLRILNFMWEPLLPDKEHAHTKVFYVTDDDNRFTCLHIAAKNGGGKELELLKYLIEEVRIEVDVIGDRRRTPLHLACEFGHLDVVKYLIEKGASTTLRTAQLLNCLEISIQKQHVKMVKYLLKRPDWRGMMRNAQLIEGTDAYDTPMRKLIRYMPDVALWTIEKKLTRKVGGAGQKVSKEIYDYEFYEDMNTVKDWYAQGAKLPPEDTSCKARCHRLGVSAIYGCYFDTGCCSRHDYDKKSNIGEPYTRDSYTLVRNHPMMLVSEQSAYPKLMAHQYHVWLRKKIFRRFSTYWLAFSFLSYIILLGLWTAVVLSGKHPQYFYALAGYDMTLDTGTCKQVANTLISQNISEVLKTTAYQRLKTTLYVFFWILIAKNGIQILALFPKVFRVGAYYVEGSALVLSFVYILDWYDWQSPVLFRCPVQYQIGAMGLLLAWMNLLTYVRCIPWLGVGIYVAMLEVICYKFLRFLPVLMIIICGFGFTYWMLLQNQIVYATPIEALIRTGLMMFDLGYEERLYKSPDNVAYYMLVYVIMVLTAIVFCIFIVNLMIGLAVGEIPTLMDEGTLWRDTMLYDFVSDGEILRLQFLRLMRFLSCYQLSRIPCMIPRPIVMLTYDERAHGWFEKAWHYTMKHFFHEKIQDDVELKISSKKEAKEHQEEKEN
ncbi:unnamed protein product [Adineta steineri]|uniref:Ion transport domain-containing protein n=1 Tax=Adineta steineri TaxID=433720 RepID=A0A819BSW9_9BILA|nr:unnamed protein product [Adineta steineri]